MNEPLYKTIGRGTYNEITVKVGDHFRWQTQDGNIYRGRIREIDGSIAIVALQDEEGYFTGEVKACEL